jgi:hypothetical protein
LPIDIQRLDAEVEVVPEPRGERAGTASRDGRGADPREVEAIVARLLRDELRRLVRQGSGT